MNPADQRPRRQRAHADRRPRHIPRHGPHQVNQTFNIVGKRGPGQGLDIAGEVEQGEEQVKERTKDHGKDERKVSGHIV